VLAAFFNVRRLNNNNKKTPYEIITKPLKPRLKRLNGKGNRVIQLFIKLYIKNPNAPGTK
jgi:hypothetical protein